MKNSHGYNEISIELLKISATCMCLPLTYICDKSVLSGIVPDHLKFSIIKPIHKKGDRMNLTNCRSLSLLTSFLKVIEIALYIRPTEHFYNNKLPVGNQFGFRKYIATEDAIYKLRYEILNALHNKTMAGSIFCNLEKAFDSANHDLLLSKLPYYGISGKAKLLLASYLQNRYQGVQIINSYLNSNTVSKRTKIKYWALQDSTLGILLFVVYIIDIPKATDHKAIPVMFVDYTNRLIINPNNIHFQIGLNIVVGQLNKLFKTNLLSLNFDKTYFIQFINKGTCTSDIQIMYKDKKMYTTIETKFLGLFSNNTVSWKTHIEYIKS